MQSINGVKSNKAMNDTQESQQSKTVVGSQTLELTDLHNPDTQGNGETQETQSTLVESQTESRHITEEVSKIVDISLYGPFYLDFTQID